MVSHPSSSFFFGYVTLSILSSWILDFLICKVENTVPAMCKVVKITEDAACKPVSWLLLAGCKYLTNMTVFIITVTIILPIAIRAQITIFVHISLWVCFSFLNSYGRLTGTCPFLFFVPRLCRLMNRGKENKTGRCTGQVSNHATCMWEGINHTLPSLLHPWGNFFNTDLESQVIKKDEANYRFHGAHRLLDVCSCRVSGLSQSPFRVCNGTIIQKLIDFVCQIHGDTDNTSFGFVSPTMPRIALTHRRAHPPPQKKSGISGLWYLHLWDHHQGNDWFLIAEFIF